jgi:hypothetical protein
LTVSRPLIAAVRSFCNRVFSSAMRRNGTGNSRLLLIG